MGAKRTRGFSLLGLNPGLCSSDSSVKSGEHGEDIPALTSCLLRKGQHSRNGDDPPHTHTSGKLGKALQPLSQAQRTRHLLFMATMALKVLSTRVTWGLRPILVLIPGDSYEMGSHIYLNQEAEDHLEVQVSNSHSLRIKPEEGKALAKIRTLIFFVICTKHR